MAYTGDMKKEEKVKVKRLNVNFKTPEEHAILKTLHVIAAESEQQLREVVIHALEKFVNEHKGRK